MRNSIQGLVLSAVMSSVIFGCSAEATSDPTVKPQPTAGGTTPVVGAPATGVPGTPTGVTPGTPTSVTPGTPTGVTPGTPTGVTPGTPTAATPAPTGMTMPAGPAMCVGSKDTISIDATGWVPKECNNVGIQGAWYCYDDGINPSGCTKGVVPYDAAKKGMCLKGKTTVDADFKAWGAGIGFSLNTGASTDAAPGAKMAYDAKTNKVTGFKFTITGTTKNKLRVSYKNKPEEAETPPMKALPGVDTYSVTFDNAVVPDWVKDGTAGNPVNTSAIYDVQIQIAGGELAEDYEFCVTDFTPITEGGSTTMPSATLKTYGTPQAGQYDTTTVGNYVVQNNRYGANTHSIQSLSDGGSKVGFTLSNVSANVATGSAPGSYPSIVYGWHVDGKLYGAYKGDKQLSALKSVPSTAKVTVPNGAGYNTSYDIWLGNAAANGNPKTELMIWLNFQSTTPIGAQVGTATIEGTSWNVWYDDAVGSDGFHTLSYVRTTNTNSATLDLKKFLDDAVTVQKKLQATQYLLGVQFGFEIWKGSTADKFSVDEYTVSVQ